MNRLKLAKFLFWLFLALALIFGILLISTNPKDDILLFVSGCLGLLGQLLGALSMYLTLRHIKRNDPE